MFELVDVDFEVVRNEDPGRGFESTLLCDSIVFEAVYITVRPL